LTKQAQDGIATSADTKLTSHIRSCLPSYPESKLTEGFLQLFGALSVRTTERGKSLDEDLLSTGVLFTKETTDMHDETDWSSTGGKIMQRPCIATLYL
jgi:hypothetical protein